MTVKSALVSLMSLVLAGCGSAPIHIEAGNRPTPAVSVIKSESERIAFQLTEPSYVAAVEVVYGTRLRALMPTDSSGVLPTGSHDVSFRAVGTMREPDRGYMHPRRPRPQAAQRFSFFGGCPGGEILYEPVPENRAASTGIESPQSSPQVNLRSVPELCTSRRVRGYGVDGRFLQVGGWAASRWVIVLASDRPIDGERLVENLTEMERAGYAPRLLAQVAAHAMAGHEGTWSAGAARR